MIKKFTVLSLLLSMALGASAETYTGQTSPVPEGSVYGPATNPDSAPGVYEKLVGLYDLNMQSAYYMIANYAGWMDSKVLVVDAGNEIVAELPLRLSATGSRYFNVVGCQITEDAAITSPGTYYFIYPTSSSWDSTNDAYLTRNESVKIYNIKAGPYVVGEVKEAVDAVFEVSPQGDIQVAEVPEAVTITVSDADMFNVGDLDQVLTVTDRATGEALVMEPGVKEGNTLKWEFPIDGTTGKMTPLAKGTYDINRGFRIIQGIYCKSESTRISCGAADI